MRVNVMWHLYPGHFANKMRAGSNQAYRNNLILNNLLFVIDVF
jgi:hypothetical protein